MIFSSLVTKLQQVVSFLCVHLYTNLIIASVTVYVFFNGVYVTLQ
jgi:hypothetical protein